MLTNSYPKTRMMNMYIRIKHIINKITRLINEPLQPDFDFEIEI